MVGKTNLAFISKGDSSNAQLIQKSYVTDINETIWKIEKINGKIFVFGGNNVLMGTEMGDLEFVRKDQKNLRVTHIIFIDGMYYCIADGLDLCIYKTKDFNEYEEMKFGGAGEKNLGIFLDTHGKIIFVSYAKHSYYGYIMRTAESIEDITKVDYAESGIFTSNNIGSNAVMIENRIYVKAGDWWRQLSLACDLRQFENGQFKVCSYAGGYFFFMKDSNSLYRSRDGIDATLVSSEMNYANIKDSFQTYVIPISGKYCLIYETSDGKNYVNIADDILNVGAPDNLIIEQADKIIAGSLFEDNGKTYVGTSGGVIYEFQLDYEGILQRPDVTVIKTLSAKQALSQSLQYTDESIESLKKYIDVKIQETFSEESGNSTEVEQTENVD